MSIFNSNQKTKLQFTKFANSLQSDESLNFHVDLLCHCEIQNETSKDYAVVWAQTELGSKNLVDELGTEYGMCSV